MNDQTGGNRPRRANRRPFKKGGARKGPAKRENFNSVRYERSDQPFDPSAGSLRGKKKAGPKNRSQGRSKNKRSSGPRQGQKFTETSHQNVDPDPLLNAPDISSWVVHEDETFLILNKPEGLNTMGSTGEDSLFSRALDYIKKNGGSKLFTAHRLDRPTSGLVTFLKDDRNLRLMQELFKKRKVQKEYWAITSSQVQVLFHEESWAQEDRPYLKIVKENRQNWLEINLPIHGIKTKSRVDFDKGLSAQTWMRVERVSGELALIHLKPKTGRFHQLRVHLSSLGFPIIGDNLYRGQESDGRLFLHAAHLEFTWPLNKKRFGLESPLPSSFREVMLKSLPPKTAPNPYTSGEDYDYGYEEDEEDGDNIGNC